MLPSPMNILSPSTANSPIVSGSEPSYNYHFASLKPSFHTSVPDPKYIEKDPEEEKMDHSDYLSGKLTKVEKNVMEVQNSQK